MQTWVVRLECNLWVILGQMGKGFIWSEWYQRFYISIVSRWYQSINYILAARIRIYDNLQDSLTLSYFGIYTDIVLKKLTVHSKRKVNLCVKIAHILEKLIAISALGLYRQGWIHGHVTCTIWQGPKFKRDHAWFNTLLWLSWQTETHVLKFLSFEQGTFHFHFVLDSTNYIAGHRWVLIGHAQGRNHSPLKEIKSRFQKEEAFKLCLDKCARFEQRYMW